MATFGQSSRAVYTKDKVKKMRDERKKLTPANPNIPTSLYQARLGELKGAGHLRFSDKHKVEIEHLTSTSIMGTPENKKVYTVKFQVGVEQGDKPHLVGYLESAANVDTKPYKIRGWINEDGTLRLEIVK